MARRKALWLAILSGTLALPALGVGWQADDYFHRTAIVHADSFRDLVPVGLNLFAFSDGAGRTQSLIRAGWLPWWTDPHLRICFFRPLAALTHRLDYALWPDSPAWMHLHSLIWLGLMVAAATMAYQGVMGPGWVAGLAALMFAVDGSHGFPAGWLAARNGLGASALALAALAIYVRGGSSPSYIRGALGPIALLGGLLFGEVALGVLGYLVAHAALIDRRRWHTRLIGLAPYAAVTVAWLVVYRMSGAGVSGSGWYCDPTENPLGCLAAELERAPIMLLGGMGLITTDAYPLLSTTARGIAWMAAVGVLGVFAFLLLAPLRRDRLAAFWVIGTLPSLLLAGLSVPSDRLLLLVGFGMLGLLARFVAAVTPSSQILRTTLPRADDEASPPPLRTNVVVRAAAVCIVAIHLIAAPLLLPLRTWSAGMLGELVARATTGLPKDTSLRDKTVIIVNSPGALLHGFRLMASETSGNHALRAPEYVLCASADPVEVMRINDRSLAIRPSGGFLPTPGTPPAGATGLGKWINLVFMLQQLDNLVRGPQCPFAVGDRVQLTGFTISITAVGGAGRPGAVLVESDRPLTDPSLCWLTFEGGTLWPFPVPAVGHSATAAGARLSLTSLLFPGVSSLD